MRICYYTCSGRGSAEARPSSPSAKETLTTLSVGLLIEGAQGSAYWEHETCLERDRCLAAHLLMDVLRLGCDHELASGFVCGPAWTPAFRWLSSAWLHPSPSVLCPGPRLWLFASSQQPRQPPAGLARYLQASCRLSFMETQTDLSLFQLQGRALHCLGTCCLLPCTLLVVFPSLPHWQMLLIPKSFSKARGCGLWVGGTSGGDSESEQGPLST